MTATLPGPASRRLPNGTRVRLGAGVRRGDGGRAMLGGSPPRLVYLTDRAVALIDDGEVLVRDADSAALARTLLDRGLADPLPGAAAPIRPGEVTVVIPVKDRDLTALLATLEGVAVIVVDDGSADPVTLRRVAQAAGARVIRHESSRGPAAARNAGLREVGTPLVAFVDSDVVPTAGWLDTLLAALDDPAVGVVAPRIAALHPGGRAVARYEAVRSSLDLGPVPGLVVPRSRVSYVPSACLVGRREAFGDGFDESMHVAEDVDLIWRTIEAGWQVRYEPAAVVGHDHRVAVGSWLSRKAFYGTGAAPLAQRHGDAVAPVVLTPWTLTVAATALTQRRWSAPLALGVTAFATLRLARRLSRSEHPVRTAATLAPLGVGSALWQCANALTRHWLPVSLGAALVSRRARRALLLAAIAGGLNDWRTDRPDLDPVTYLVLRRLDDAAYGAGVWCGALRRRTTLPLRPHVLR
jgi:mycofactocin system glycosyltransferase